MLGFVIICKLVSESEVSKSNDNVCFGLTKEQAIDGYVNSRKNQLQSLHTQIRRIELEVKEALEFRKEEETK